MYVHVFSKRPYYVHVCMYIASTTFQIYDTVFFNICLLEEEFPGTLVAKGHPVMCQISSYSVHNLGLLFLGEQVRNGTVFHQVVDTAKETFMKDLFVSEQQKKLLVLHASSGVDGNKINLELRDGEDSRMRCRNIVGGGSGGAGDDSVATVECG